MRRGSLHPNQIDFNPDVIDSDSDGEMYDSKYIPPRISRDEEDLRNFVVSGDFSMSDVWCFILNISQVYR